MSQDLHMEHIFHNFSGWAEVETASFASRKYVETTRLMKQGWEVVFNL